jgi:hypothetical protein
MNRFKNASVLSLLIESDLQKARRRKRDFMVLTAVVCAALFAAAVLWATGGKILTMWREARVGNASGRAG